MSDKKVTIEFDAKVKDAQLAQLTAKINALKEASKQARDASGKLKEELKKTDAVSEETAAGIKQVTSELDKLARAADKSVSKLGEASSQTSTNVRNLNNEVQKGAKSQRNLGYATLEASRGLEDLQYGVKGVLNNIPTLIMQLGGSAGLAGVLSVVAVGLSILYTHLGSVKVSADSLNESMDGLADSFGKTTKITSLNKGLKDLIKSLDDESEAIKRNTDVNNANLTARQALRQMKLDEIRMQAELDKLEIDQSKMSEPDKVAAKGEIDKKVGILEGKEKVKLAEEDIELSQSKIEALEKEKAIKQKLLDQAKETLKIEREKELEKSKKFIEKQSEENAKKISDMDFSEGSISRFFPKTATDPVFSFNESDDIFDLLEEYTTAQKEGEDPEKEKEIIKKILDKANKVKEDGKGDYTRAESNLLEIAGLLSDRIMNAKSKESVDKALEDIKKAKAEAKKIVDESGEILADLDSEIEQEKIGFQTNLQKKYNVETIVRGEQRLKQGEVDKSVKEAQAKKEAKDKKDGSKLDKEIKGGVDDSYRTFGEAQAPKSQEEMAKVAGIIQDNIVTKQEYYQLQNLLLSLSQAVLDNKNVDDSARKKIQETIDNIKKRYTMNK